MASSRSSSLSKEAKLFCEHKSAFPKLCQTHEPTLEELQSTTFSEYIREKVLKGCQEPDGSYREGMAKVILPANWWSEAPMKGDRTGRGPAWQAGQSLGDLQISSPIQQHIQGMAGIYEYTLLDQPSLTLHEFRAKADAFFQSQLSLDPTNTEETIDYSVLERKFWKRLGPTMSPPLYGADMEGSLFTDDCKIDWNLSRLESCLNILGKDLPGVTTPYLYFGMWASVFCAHTEDLNLLSINYLHAGAPKLWYAIAPGIHSKRFEALCDFHYAHARKECKEYLRHKRCLLSPLVLKKAGILFSTQIQFPGDAMITFPGGYHFGFNAGFNVAEATNFAVPEWVELGRSAGVCLCRPDSVQINVDFFRDLLEEYEKRTNRRLGYSEWARRKHKKKQQASEDEKKQEEKEIANRKNVPKSDQEKRNEFWIQVADQRKPRQKKRRRGRDDENYDVWHLAKPLTRKAIQVNTNVLCVLPISQTEEECFVGTIIEMTEDHVRVRFEGLLKKDDTWIEKTSKKLYLDGGVWDDSMEMPALHYWKEVDSKRRCR